MNKNIKILTDQRFGKLLVKEFVDTKNGHARYICKCDCGVEKIMYATHLKRKSKNIACGCLTGKSSYTHKMSRTRTYYSWTHMKERVSEYSDHKKDYYDRGIGLDDIRWNYFENFLEDMGERPKGMTLDRIENNKGYSKSNCRWATPKKQANNRRNTRFFTFNNQSKTLSEWAQIYKIDYDNLYNRIARKWPIDRALIEPFKDKNGKRI